MNEKITIRKSCTFEQAQKFIRDERTVGKTVAFTSGCFDVMHVGHILFLEECAGGVDSLVVGVDDNVTVTAAKGKDHPFFDETERLKVLSSLSFVDIVFLFRGPFNAELLKSLNPNFYCFSPFDPKLHAKEADAKSAGVQVKMAGLSLKSWSSSRTGRLVRYSFMTEPWVLPPEA